MREVIAMVEDLPEGAEDTVDLAYEFHTGIPAIDDTTRRLRADRERIKREEKDLAERTAQVARDLVTRYSMSVRDAAALTGVTKQRVSQVAPRRARRRTGGRAKALPSAINNRRSKQITASVAKTRPRDRRPSTRQHLSPFGGATAGGAQNGLDHSLRMTQPQRNGP